MQAIGLFCEDVRQEKSEQVTLIGVMPDNLNIGTPPPSTDENAIIQGMLPKIALYVRVQLEPEDDPGEIQIRLILPNGEVSEIAKFSAEFIETSKKQAKENNTPIAGLISYMVFLGFRVSGPGQILAVLDSKYGRQICAVLNLVTS